MFQPPLFSVDMDPACAWCVYGVPTADGEVVLCKKRGVVAPSFHCRSWVYDPLQRSPKPPPPLRHYDLDDFSLD
ncbi:MAG: hypothetical protein RR135_02205 [Oscillospiraceae bacterium]